MSKEDDLKEDMQNMVAAAADHYLKSYVNKPFRLGYRMEEILDARMHTHFANWVDTNSMRLKEACDQWAKDNWNVIVEEMSKNFFFKRSSNE